MLFFYLVGQSVDPRSDQGESADRLPIESSALVFWTGTTSGFPIPYRIQNCTESPRRGQGVSSPSTALHGFDNPMEAAERLPDGIDADTLRKYFTLTKPDLAEVEQCRGAVNKLGFAIQLCTLRWQGYFLSDTRNLPSEVIETIASQTGVLALAMDTYPQNEKTRWEHRECIRRHLGLVRCDANQRERLLNHRVGVAQALPRSEGLRQAAHQWLKHERIVRPGRTTIRDLITSAREAALQAAFQILTSGLALGQVEQIESLLLAPAAPDQPGDEPAFRSRLEQFKTPARKESPEALLMLLDQLSQIASLDLTALPALADVHPATRRLLAGWGYRYNI